MLTSNSNSESSRVSNSAKHLSSPCYPLNHHTKCEAHCLQPAHSWVFRRGIGTESVWWKLRLNTSALAGDPDPYPRVFQIQNAIPGSVQVSATGWLGAVSQKLAGSRVLVGPHVLESTRVPHGYGNTHGVSKMGNTGSGTVSDFGTPRTPHTRTAVLWVFHG